MLCCEKVLNKSNNWFFTHVIPIYICIMISNIPVHITPKALAKIKLIMDEKAVPEGYGLRVGTTNSVSCGTTSFMLGFDTKKSGDDSFNFEGIEVLINKKEMLYLINLTLDYEEGKEISGFKFEKSTN